MRIIFASHLFLPKHFGGTEILTYGMASEMKRRGHDVHVLHCDSFTTGRPNEVVAVEEVFENLKVHRVSLNIKRTDDPVRAEYFNPHVEEHLLDYYRRVQPDLVHANHCSYLSTAILTAAQKLRIPTVFIGTDYWMICPTKQLLRWNTTLCDGPNNLADCLRCYTHLSSRGKKYRWLMETLPDGILNTLVDKAASSKMDFLGQVRALKAAEQRARWNRDIINHVGLFISPSRFLESLFLQNGLTNPHRLYMPFGVSPLVLQSNFEKNQSPVLRFGFIGTISKHKGLHLLVEAFKSLPLEAPARLKIYGEPEFDPRYGRWIRRMAEGEKRIDFCGVFPHERMATVMRDIDVLIVPSMWYENTPLVIYSALATGTPVVCTNLGGMAELVRHGENGLMFEMGDVQSLRERLLELIREPQRLHQLRPDRTRLKTIDENADQLECSYGELLSRSGNATHSEMSESPIGSALSRA